MAKPRATVGSMLALDGMTILGALEYLIGSPYAPNPVRIVRVNDSQGDAFVVEVGDRYEERGTTLLSALSSAVGAVQADAHRTAESGAALLATLPTGSEDP